MEPLPDAEPLWLALVKPSVDVSTPTVFRAVTPADYGDDADTEAVIAALRAGQPLPFDRLTNTLERGVMRAYPEVARAQKTLLDLGASLVVMSGSGPSLFAPYRSLREAASLVERARERQLNAWLCHSVPARRRWPHAANPDQADGFWKVSSDAYYGNVGVGRVGSGPVIIEEQESALVTRATQRDHDAFTRLYQMYFDRIYRYIRLNLATR